MNPIVIAGLDVLDLTFKYLVEAVAVIIIIGEIYRKLKSIKKESDDEHEWRMRINKVVEVVEKKEEIWDKGLADIYEERGKIVDRFDTKLAGLEDTIITMKTDNEAKNKELKEDIIVLVKGQKACLDGLVEKGCNGPVKIARDDLNNFLVNSI